MLLKLLHFYYALQHLTMNPNHEILFFHEQRKKKKTLDHKIRTKNSNRAKNLRLIPIPLAKQIFPRNEFIVNTVLAKVFRRETCIMHGKTFPIRSFG